MAGCLPELAQSRIGRAIAADSTDQLLKCMQQHENIFLRDKRDNNYIHYACTMHRPKMLHLLLTTDLDIDAQNKSGNTPLHISAICNQSCVVPVLMMYGADPYMKNNENKLASDIKTINGTWKAAYRMYEPGVFLAVENGDGDKLLELMKKWCKTDVQKKGRTLRQRAAMRGHHHLLRMMDRHKFTLECIYGVLEQNYDNFETGVRKNGCNVNWLNEGCGHRHIIQYALEWRKEDMVTLLCDRGADVNMLINYKNYIKAPLYFIAIGNQAISGALMRRVLDSGVDIHSKDERGRNAVMFAMDRSPAARLAYVVDFFMSRGLSIADRDDTGASVRNLAMLNDDKNIIGAVDKSMIKLIRQSEIDTLWRMAEDGYDDFFFEYLWKDSLIYAAGNDTDDVTIFLHHMKQFTNEVDRMNHLLSAGTGNEEELRHFLDDNRYKSRLLVTKDRAGRTPLTRAVMLGRRSLVDYFLSHDVCINALNERKDNLYRTSLHYAYCVRDHSPDGELIVELLLATGADPTTKDVCGLCPEAFSDGRPKEKLLCEMSRAYGMTMEMHLLRKYKEMYKIITSKGKADLSKYKKFLRISRNLWYPMSAMPKALTPRGIPLVKRYRDLLFIAIEEKQEDIAKKLVYLGSDCERQEWIIVNEDDHQIQKLMTPSQYATYRGLPELADYIEQRKLCGPARTVLFHKMLTSVNDERLPGFLMDSKEKIGRSVAFSGVA